MDDNILPFLWLSYNSLFNLLEKFISIFGSYCFIIVQSVKYWFKYRMWEDIVYGLEQLGNSEDYITFLGSVITMHDIKHESIAPIVRGETP
jgi:hypothetical protein